MGLSKEGIEQIYLTGCYNHRKVGIVYVVNCVRDHCIKTFSFFRINSHLVSILFAFLSPLYIVLFFLSTYWMLTVFVTIFQVRLLLQWVE